MKHTPAREPIKFRYNTVDGFSESKTFVTLAGARSYFERRIGKAFDVSLRFNYAIDAYGTGKLTIVSGTTWKELVGYATEEMP